MIVSAVPPEARGRFRADCYRICSGRRAPGGEGQLAAGVDRGVVRRAPGGNENIAAGLDRDFGRDAVGADVQPAAVIHRNVDRRGSGMDRRGSVLQGEAGNVVRNEFRFRAVSDIREIKSGMC